MARMGMAVVNDPAAAAVAGSKAETAVALALAGVPSPRQITHPQGVAPETALGAGEWQWPLVLKWDKGSSGVGVHLARDAGEAAELLGSVADGLPWVAQQFRAECRGRDLRVYVFGGRVFGGLERWSTTGDFRSNVALGAASAPCPVTREEADVAVRAAAAVGLRVAGVDILRTDDGPMVAEVNSNPVLDTYSRATGSSAIYEAFADAVCAAPAAGAPGASRPVGLTTLSA
jgi:ribosomal protein S6--L-glutamate ligase